MELTAERLREMLKYYPGSGKFMWLKHTSSTGRAYGSAGNINAIGYVRISVDGRSYLAHRLAWLYMTGAWPSELIDHINGDRQDNRFCNLREATVRENQQNIEARAGSLGTYWNKKSQRWAAQIRLGDGRRKGLGLFATQVDAHQAYLKAKAEHHTFSPTPRST